jgi:hypothetical protein
MKIEEKSFHLKVTQLESYFASIAVNAVNSSQKPFLERIDIIPCVIG